MSNSKLLKELEKLARDIRSYGTLVDRAEQEAKDAEAINEFELLVSHALKTGERQALERARALLAAALE